MKNSPKHTERAGFPPAVGHTIRTVSANHIATPLIPGSAPEAHWSQLSDSNRQPLDYKSRALPIEAKLADLAAGAVCPITNRRQARGERMRFLGIALQEARSLPAV